MPIPETPAQSAEAAAPLPHAPAVPHPLDEAAITTCVEAAVAAFDAAGDLGQLKAARLAHTGDKAPIVMANRQIKDLDKAEKKDAGRLLGSARGQIQKALAVRTEVLEAEHAQRMLIEETVDVTAAVRRRRPGARHPLSLLQEKVADVFVSMGWDIAEGPEVESEWFNFDALNIAPDHPAREMQDTFFIDPPESHMVLRTHTSPVQVRALLERPLPVYVLCPGRTYRTDELDATHTPVFHQFEGLAVDKGLTMADLKGTLEHFARLMFGKQAAIRLRPSFFPFTEPSAELDVWDPNAKGGPRWVEWGGCGMVNPAVLRAAGVDPEEYTGFAFGMGVERTLMFRNAVPDMRDMIEGDIRFSQQFGQEV